MNQDTFDSPSIHLNRIYTRAGDGGDTRLAGGQVLPKEALRIETYGTVDELNAFVGAARVTQEAAAAQPTGLLAFSRILRRVQHELFNLGSILATLPQDVHPKQPRVTDVEIARLEAEMDAMNAALAPLRSFVLPGGSRLD